MEAMKIDWVNCESAVKAIEEGERIAREYRLAGHRTVGVEFVKEEKQYTRPVAYTTTVFVPVIHVEMNCPNT